MKYYFLINSMPVVVEIEGDQCDLSVLARVEVANGRRCLIFPPCQKVTQEHAEIMARIL